MINPTIRALSESSTSRLCTITPVNTAHVTGVAMRAGAVAASVQERLPRVAIVQKPPVTGAPRSVPRPKAAAHHSEALTGDVRRRAMLAAATTDRAMLPARE